MRVRNQYGEVFEVSVGDYVGWKGVREDSGKITNIKLGRFGVDFVVDTESGTQVIPANRCWPE